MNVKLAPERNPDSVELGKVREVAPDAMRVFPVKVILASDVAVGPNALYKSVLEDV